MPTEFNRLNRLNRLNNRLYTIQCIAEVGWRSRASGDQKLMIHFGRLNFRAHSMIFNDSVQFFKFNVDCFLVLISSADSAPSPILIYIHLHSSTFMRSKRTVQSDQYCSMRDRSSCSENSPQTIRHTNIDMRSLAVTMTVSLTRHY